MSSPYRKDVREFIQYAKGHGFRCEGMGGGGHWRLRHDSGAVLIVPATPGGYRWRKNLESIMKKIAQGEKS
jgi:predicted RNA binding protein YcfA (HicA-like mRNA interferase family)